MSRGAKVFYINDSNSLPEISPADGTMLLAQEFDIAIVRNEDLTDAISNSLATIEDEAKKRYNIFQVRRSGAAPFALNWSQLGFADNRIIFTDDNIIPNVTKSRKSHIEEIRNFINGLYSIMSSKYGSDYFHSHNFTKAQMIWSSDTDRAKIEFVDHGVDAKWLTVFFGDNHVRNDEINSDRFRIATIEEDNTNNTVADFFGWSVKLYKDLNLSENITVSKSANILLDLTVKKNLNVSEKSVFDGEVAFNEKINVNKTSDFYEDVHVLKNIKIDDLLTTKNLKVESNVTFDFDITIAGSIAAKYVNASEGISAPTANFGTATLSKDLAVEGDALIKGNLEVKESVVVGSSVEANNMHAQTMNLLGNVFYHNLKPIITFKDNEDSMLIGNPIYSEIAGSSEKFTWNGATVWTESFNGHGKGIDADMLDGKHSGNNSGDIPVNNSGVCKDLNADMIDGWHLEEIRNLSKQGHDQGFNADMLDGFHAEDFLSKTEQLQSAISGHILANTLLQTPQAPHGIMQGEGGQFNADLLDGLHAQEIINYTTNVETNLQSQIPLIWLNGEEWITPAYWTFTQGDNPQFPAGLDNITLGNVLRIKIGGVTYKIPCLREGFNPTPFCSCTCTCTSYAH